MMYLGLFDPKYAVHYFLPLTVFVSLSLVKTKRQDQDCLHRRAVGMTLSLSKISVSQSSDTSQYVSTYISNYCQIS